MNEEQARPMERAAAELGLFRVHNKVSGPDEEEEKVAGRRSAERETLSLNVSAHVLRRDKLPLLCSFVFQANDLIQL